MRIAKAKYPVADDHRDDGITTAAPTIYGTLRGEHIGRRDARCADALQFRSEYVEQDFRVGLGVQVATILAHQYLGELGHVGEITVVTKADAVGRVHIEGLRFGSAVTSRRRITNVPDAIVALQLQHVPLLEDIPHQAAALALEKLAILRGHDARGVLAAMLQNRQRIVDALVDG